MKIYPSVYLINQSFVTWAETPISTNIETLPITELPFPKVTVCPPKNTLTNLNYDLEKLARNTIENVTVTNESGDKTCHLRSIRGGRYPASFNIGKATVATEENAFSFDDVLALQSEANLADRYSDMF